jgi:hypothetical protein
LVISKSKRTATGSQEQQAEDQHKAGIDPEILGKIAALHAQVGESFGKVVMAMMALPHYRHATLTDLNHIVLEPLLRDRIAIAFPGKDKDDPLTDVAGMAILASVSEGAVCACDTLGGRAAYR